MNMKNYEKFILLSYVLGALYSFLFYNKALGISVPIFMIGALLFLLFCLHQTIGIKKNTAWLLAIPIALLSFRFFLSDLSFRLFRDNSLLVFFIPLAIVVLCTAMVLLLSEKCPVEWTSIHFIPKILHGFFAPIQYFARPYRWFYSKFFSSSEPRQSNGYVKKILLGLCLTLPFLFIIVRLLASADMVFGQALSSIPKLIIDEVTNHVVVVILVTLFVGTYACAYAWNLLVDDQNTAIKAEGSHQTKEKKYFDPIVVTTILATINIVYIAFSFIQFSYLFGGGLASLPEGFSYAEYARRGFSELLVVTTLNFSIMLFSLYTTDLKRKHTGRIIKGMLWTMGIFTYVMLFSSFYRMRMYEQAYGYTYQRIFVYFFLCLEAVLLLAVLWYIARPQFSLIKVCIITTLVFFVFLNYLNADKMIAKENIDRYFETGKIDIEYLKTLSYDAIPQISRLSEAPDAYVVNEVASYLANVKIKLRKPQSWQEFNWAKYKAKKALE